MRSREYRAHRRACFVALGNIRASLKRCDRGDELARDLRDPQAVVYWESARADFTRRLGAERLILHALRIGGVPRWRSTVLALRPRGTERLLSDLLAGP